jgi:glycosyltransferase involved in cell wall biosynthesis
VRAARPVGDGPASPSLLLVVNEVTGFGFAWTHFEKMYALIAERLAPAGVRTLVAYPKITQAVTIFAAGRAEVVELDARPNSLESFLKVGRFARAQNVRAVFFIDQRSLHPWSYGILRLFGVRRVVVYNQTSGMGYRSAPVKRLIKWVLARLPWMTPDVIVGVSDFVVTREMAVNCLPPRLMARVHNAVAVPPGETASQAALYERLGLDRSRPVIMTACRAVREKGVDHLFRAFEMLMSAWAAGRPRPILVYVGTGPQFEELEALRRELAAGDSIVMTGYRSDVDELSAGAAISVVPSVWQDACPYSVLDGMAQGCAVIATRVGGVPEMIDSEAVGLLVPPGDEGAMSAAMRRLLDDPELRRTMGRNARHRIAAFFRPELQADQLVRLLAPALTTQ